MLLLQFLEPVVMGLEELLADDGQQVVFTNIIRHVRQYLVPGGLDVFAEIANRGEWFSISGDKLAEESGDVAGVFRGHFARMKRQPGLGFGE